MMDTINLPREKVEQLVRDAIDPTPSWSRTIARLMLIGIQIERTRC